MEALSDAPRQFDLLALGEGRRERMARTRRNLLVVGLVGAVVLAAVFVPIAIDRAVPGPLRGPGIIPLPVLLLGVVGLVLVTMGVTASAMGRPGPVVREGIMDRSSVTFRFVNGAETRIPLNDPQLSFLVIDRRRAPPNRRWKGQETGALLASRSRSGLLGAIPLSADCLDAVLAAARNSGADIQTSPNSALVSVRAKAFQ